MTTVTCFVLCVKCEWGEEKGDSADTMCSVQGGNARFLSWFDKVVMDMGRAHGKSTAALR